MVPTLSIGPFELAEKIGEGGMGVVYRGIHRRTGVDVAIKTISPNRHGESTGDRFQSEVQSHAALVHPHVVYLFDYGAIPERVARQIGMNRPIGDEHFVAMEFADRGTLRDGVDIGDWPTLRSVLVQILDGLAYSHARGVIHRDLKPDNLLVFDADGDIQIKLADFGLAHAIYRTRNIDADALESMSGTPYYMAPEQARGNWRKFGPWTDLYALGCIAWELACGRRPFEGPHLPALLLKHAGGQRPPLEPRFPVPDELEEWIHRAMAVDPSARFQRAADAAYALPSADGFDTRNSTVPGDELSEVETRIYRPDSGVDSRRPTRRNTEFVPTLQPTRQLTWSDEPPRVQPADSTSRHIDGDPAPVVADWHTDLAEQLPLPLVDTGLGLFELRETPFVDRDRERDAIWQQLVRTADDDTPRLVAVAGPSGVGKSRIAEWICTRAHELGAATLFRALHTRESQGVGEGLEGMIRYAFRGWKIDRAELYRHLLEQLPPLSNDDRFRELDARALTELVFPTGDEDDVQGPTYRFSSAPEKYSFVARLFHRFGRRRPVIVWLDDAQWNDDALGLAEFLLDDTDRQNPVLILMTLRSDVLAEHPAVDERIASLVEHDRARRLDVTSLSADDHRKFIDRMLRLDERLADTVAERTEGNPLFASQLLGDWIERDWLIAGDDGFRLADSVEPDLPDDVHQLWTTRLRRLVDSVAVVSEQTAQSGIECAAALGREVNQREWIAACDFDRESARTLREHLVERGLAKRTDDGFSFAHGLLVDSIAENARRRQTWKDHHLNCARMLRRIYPNRPEQIARRRADHLMEAGALEEALQPLFVEQRRLKKLGKTRARRRCLQTRSDLMDRLGLSDTDIRRIENEIDRVRCEVTAGELEQSLLDRLRDLEAAIDGAKYPVVNARALRYLGTCHRLRNELPDARKAYDRALKLVTIDDDPIEWCEVVLSYGFTEYWNRNYDRAAALFERVQEHFDVIDNPYLRMRCELDLILVEIDSGRSDRPVEQLTQLLERLREHGFGGSEMSCLGQLGELARFDGDVETARRSYRQVYELSLQLHWYEDAQAALLNLAQTELMAGRIRAAQARLTEFNRLAASDTRQIYNRLLNFLKLAIAAGDGQWDEFDRRIDRIDDQWPDDVPLWRDYPWLTAIAAGFADDTGKSARADRARRIAARLYRRYGDDDEARRLESSGEADHTDETAGRG